MNTDYKRYFVLAKMCKAVYGSPVRQDLLSYNDKKMVGQKIVHGSYGRGFCRLFWNDETLVIAFRGTRENVDWWASNLKMFPVLLKNCETNSKKINVHRGFQRTLYHIDKTTQLNSFNAVMKHINDLELFENRKIVITGHSLGGALATLFSVKLRSNIPIIVANQLQEIILFGTPAVGLKNFKIFYNELHQKTIRIINGSDVVPFTPPIFYHHVGKQLWIKKNEINDNKRWLIRFLYALKLPLKNFINDHDMKSYMANLKELDKKHNLH